MHVLFGNREDGGSDPAGSLRPLALTKRAVNLLNGGLANRSDGLSIAVRRRARQRLEAAGVEIQALSEASDAPAELWLRFVVEEVTCLFFGTGVGLLLFEVSYPFGRGKNVPIPLDVIQEINFDLARAVPPVGHTGQGRVARCRDVARWEGAGTEPFRRFAGIGELATHVLGAGELANGIAEVADTVHWEKAPIYCGVRVHQVLDEHERLMIATRLARKETSDYRPRTAEIVGATYLPFERLTHAAAVEGGATVIDGSAEGLPEHLMSFIQNSMKQAYLPLMLWALHEHLFLTERIKATSVRIRLLGPTGVCLDQLRDFRHRILSYRFQYRFSNASAVTTHNEMFRLWRKVLDLRQILNEIDHDVTEADGYIATEQAQKGEEREKRYQRILGFTVACIGSAIAIPDWIGVSLKDTAPALCGPQGRWSCPDFSLHYLLVGALVLSLGSLGAYVLVRARDWFLEKLESQKQR